MGNQPSCCTSSKFGKETAKMNIQFSHQTTQISPHQDKTERHLTTETFSVYKGSSDRDSKLQRLKVQIDEVSNSNHEEAQGHKEREAELDFFVESKLTAGKPWTDVEFPPSRGSLFNEDLDELTSSEKQFYSSLSWRRASEIYPELMMHKNGIFNVYEMSQG